LFAPSLQGGTVSGRQCGRIDCVETQA